MIEHFRIVLSVSAESPKSDARGEAFVGRMYFIPASIRIELGRAEKIAPDRCSLRRSEGPHDGV